MRLIAILLVVACGGNSSSPSRAAFDASGALLPDTQTVEGVLEMRHDADAFDRAATWVVDESPVVIYDGGDDHDLDYASHFIRLSDGRAVALFGHGQQELLLFGTDGALLRQLARRGEGPGEVAGSGDVIVLPGDTIVFADHATRRVTWFTPDSGFLHTAPIPPGRGAGCQVPAGVLPGRMLVGIGRCGQDRLSEDGTLQVTTPLLRFGLDFSARDTIAMVTASRMKWIDITVGGRTDRVMTWPQFGPETSIAVFDSLVVVGTADGGYALDFLTADGALARRIVVERPPVLVDDAFLERVVERRLMRDARDRSPQERDSIRRAILAEPFADTVAAYARITASPDHLWVIDVILPGDTTWSATAFRADGAIAGRLHVPRRLGTAYAFGANEVILSHEDYDGVRRFVVYRSRER